MPLWLASCHNRSDVKIESLRSITPSLLPPFAGLSNSASAIKPLGLVELGCGVKLPNSSCPLSILPLPFLSRAKNASSEFIAVHAIGSAKPLELRSKLVPCCGSVKSNPLPEMSMRMGLELQTHMHHILLQ